MAFEDLNFSNWTSGSENYSSSFKEAKTTKAKAKAAAMRGLESGFGTVIGAIVGGYFGGVGGASSGAQIGGGLLSGDMEKTKEGVDGLTSRGASTSASGAPKWYNDLSKKQKSDLAFDPMQYVSSMNAIPSGDVVDAMVAKSKLYGGLI